VAAPDRGPQLDGPDIDGVADTVRKPETVGRGITQEYPRRP
jgi:hypothetical protein